MAAKPPYFAVLRHSERLDMMESSQHGNDNHNYREAVWNDRATRPLDPPISDYDLPRTVVADHIVPLMSPTKNSVVIYSSPFRRCLQTAAVAATNLQVQEIIVHPGLGEIMVRVRKCCDGNRSEQGNNDELPNDNYLLTEEDCAREIATVSHGQVRMTIPSLLVTGSNNNIPPWNETTQQSMTRLSRTLAELQEQHANKNEMEHSVLVVTHGDALQAAAQTFLGQSTTVYDLQFCALMVFDADSKLQVKHGLQMLELV